MPSRKSRTSKKTLSPVKKAGKLAPSASPNDGRLSPNPRSHALNGGRASPSPRSQTSNDGRLSQMSRSHTSNDGRLSQMSSQFGKTKIRRDQMSSLLKSPSSMSKYPTPLNGADGESLKSRSPIKCVNMNISGELIVMNNIPQYKINHIEEFLETAPDVDSFSKEKISEIFSRVKVAKYGCTFQIEAERGKKGSGKVSPQISPPTTALAWNMEKYFGTPLDIEDTRLGDYADWVQRHNITVVKLDSLWKAGGHEDVYPSLIAISWHGKDIDSTLGAKNKDLEEMIDFIVTLRNKNWNIPLLVGADFNLDLRAYENLQQRPGSLVPHDSSSGGHRELKNTFLYTMDSLQITDTQSKQFHPEVFPHPWMCITIRTKYQISIWAIVTIQRFIRSFLVRKRDRIDARRKMKESKERWMKKILGPEYKKAPPTPNVEPPKEDHSVDRNEGNQNGENDGEVHTGNYGFRRRKYKDLKSLQERKEERRAMDMWMNS